ncbi:MAG: hypothetical protein KatS3mg053_2269 [Candidatus Roseilinea sp.]|nr:MAG: hypothetical protein KatS3mg053_2269 [Candidatus Roseilinea sp.]
MVRALNPSPTTITSPGWKRVTVLPTASTVPTMSAPRIGFFGLKKPHEAQQLGNLRHFLLLNFKVFLNASQLQFGSIQQTLNVGETIDDPL